MRAITTTLLLVLCAGAVPLASARNVPYFLKLKDVLESPAFTEKVGNAVTFAFADQHVSVAKTYEEYVVDARQHFKGRSDEGTCRDTLIAALAELKEHADDNDADAVIEIVSYFRRKTFEQDGVRMPRRFDRCVRIPQRQGRKTAEVILKIAERNHDEQSNYRCCCCDRACRLREHAQNRD